MHKLNSRGSLNGLLIPFILMSLLMVGAAGFGVWAYMSRADYRDNVDKKITVAVDVAKKENSSAKDNEFTEKEKLPLKVYNGPAAYGSISLQYPKTWSAYIIEGQGSQAVDGYLQPGFVSNVNSTTAFALRIQITSTNYDQEVLQFDSLTKAGSVKAAPFALAKVSSVTGVRLDGAIFSGKSGSMVLLPMRDKTLKIWTESNDFVGDFNNNILPNLVFIP